jgi:hypothetical protein
MMATGGYVATFSSPASRATPRLPRPASDRLLTPQAVVVLGLGMSHTPSFDTSAAPSLTWSLDGPAVSGGSSSLGASRLYRLGPVIGLLQPQTS